MFILDYWDSDYSLYVLTRSKESVYIILLNWIINVFLYDHQRNQSLENLYERATDTII
jgi:hypothetical protein